MALQIDQDSGVRAKEARDIEGCQQWLLAAQNFHVNAELCTSFQNHSEK
jgi:hypothetical protein